MKAVPFTAVFHSSVETRADFESACKKLGVDAPSDWQLSDESYGSGDYTMPHYWTRRGTLKDPAIAGNILRQRRHAVLRLQGYRRPTKVITKEVKVEHPVRDDEGNWSDEGGFLSSTYTTEKVEVVVELPEKEQNETQ